MGGNRDAVVYCIDSHDRLTEVNEAWQIFAAANEGQSLHADRILGQPLWNYIVDSTTQQLYRTLLQRAREGGKPVQFRFRCDAPDIQRLLAMKITADKSGGLCFSVTPVREKSRPPISLLRADRTTNLQEFVTLCSWCKQVRLSNDDWVDVDVAVRALGLFGQEPLPAITHGMCPTCYTAMMGAVEQPNTAGMEITLGPINQGDETHERS